MMLGAVNSGVWWDAYCDFFRMNDCGIKEQKPSVKVYWQVCKKNGGNRVLDVEYGPGIHNS